MADKQRESIDCKTDFIVDEDGTAYDVRENKSNVGELTVKVNADFSEMLTGLKAVERQAKAAKRAVAELEGQKSNGIDSHDLTFPKYTAVKVYGKGGLQAEYISSLARVFGKNYAPDINDDRLTSEEGIRSYASQYLVMLNERRLSDYSTKELADELAKREGVEERIVDPEEYVTINVHDNGGCTGNLLPVISGPARIVVNRD